MTVVTSLKEHTCHSGLKRQHDQQFIDAVANEQFQQLELQLDETSIQRLELDDHNRRRLNMAYQLGRGQGAIERERYGFTVQPFKPRSQKLARFEALATIMVGVCLYGLVIAALLHVIVAAR